MAETENIPRKKRSYAFYATCGLPCGERDLALFNLSHNDSCGGSTPDRITQSLTFVPQNGRGYFQEKSNEKHGRRYQNENYNQ